MGKYFGFDLDNGILARKWCSCAIIEPEIRNKLQALSIGNIQT